MNAGTTYGTLPDGTDVTEYALSRPGAPRVTVLDLGATVNSVRLDPDDPGSEVAIGFRDLASRTPAASAYFGSVIGRVANRIARGRFTLDGVDHQLTVNNGENTLHGGSEGFDARVWRMVSASDDEITLELVSPDGDQGFPGELTARATYRLLDDGLGLDLLATTDRATACVLSNHLYWNLSGSGTIDDHLVTIDADQYVPIDAASIPLGHLEEVAGSPFDLRTPTRIGDAVRSAHEQIGRANGVDHSFEVRCSGLRRAARVEDPASGRVLELFTDAPALQVYTSNFFNGDWASSSGTRLRQGDALALEPQRHPDAPNQNWADDAVLRPGETFSCRIEWRFSSR